MCRSHSLSRTKHLDFPNGVRAHFSRTANYSPRCVFLLIPLFPLHRLFSLSLSPYPLLLKMNFFLYSLAFHVCILYMASGSGSHGQEGEESSWLDLGLGLGPNYPSTATPSTTITAAQYSSSLLPSLPWGHYRSLLGLGFGDDGVRRPAGAMHYCDGWHYHSLANLPSSSSSIFPNASLFLSSGRVRPEVGLWFSLVALPCWYSTDHCLFVFCHFSSRWS